MIKIPKPRKRSVLHDQSIKAEKTPSSSSSSMKTRALGQLGLALLGSAAVFYAGYSFGFLTNGLSYIQSVFLLTPKHWQVHIHGDRETVPDQLKSDIEKVSQKIVSSGSSSELQQLVKSIETLGNFDQVQALRPNLDSLVIQVKHRTPYFLVEVGPKTRFMTKDGTIYGVFDESSQAIAPPTEHWITFKGILAGHSNHTFDSSQKLLLNSEELALLQDGLEIYQKLPTTSFGLEVRVIQFKKFRGFELILENQTIVTLGHKPFDYKLKKLRDIFDGAQKDGLKISKIELDYDGKAFIKERRM